MNKEDAIKKANIKIRESLCQEVEKKGGSYDWLEFELSCENTIDDGREAYYIKVVGGEWATTEYNNPFKRNKPKNNSKFAELLSKAEYIHCDGIFNNDSRIRCIIYKDNGEYVYLGK